MDDWGLLIASAATEEREWWEVWQVPSAISAAVIAAFLGGIGLGVRSLWMRRAATLGALKHVTDWIRMQTPVRASRFRAATDELILLRQAAAQSAGREAELQQHVKRLGEQLRTRTGTSSSASNDGGRRSARGTSERLEVDVRSGWGSRRVTDHHWALKNEGHYFTLVNGAEWATGLLHLEFFGRTPMPQHTVTGLAAYGSLDLDFMGDPGPEVQHLLIRWQPHPGRESEALLKFPQ